MDVTLLGPQSHSLELKAEAREADRSAGKTYVRFEGALMGVGGINSWGQRPMEAYRLPARERTFVFTLKPVK